MAYCLIDESNLDFFKQKIIFEEYLPKDLKEKIDSPRKEKEQQKESLSTSTFSENL